MYRGRSVFTGDTEASFYSCDISLDFLGLGEARTLLLGLATASGVVGDTREITVASELPASDFWLDLVSSKLLKLGGMWMTDCGSSLVMLDRNSLGIRVSILCARSCSCQNVSTWTSWSMHTLPALCGLVISMSGDCTSPLVCDCGDFTSLSS